MSAPARRPRDRTREHVHPRAHPGVQRRRLVAWADECDRLAAQLHGSVCRLRDRAARLREEAQQ